MDPLLIGLIVYAVSWLVMTGVFIEVYGRPSEDAVQIAVVWPVVLLIEVGSWIGRRIR